MQHIILPQVIFLFDQALFQGSDPGPAYSLALQR